MDRKFELIRFSVGGDAHNPALKKSISASVERDDHYVEIAGRGTTNLNSQALLIVVVGVSVFNSSAQSLRGLTTPLLSIKIIFCLTTS